MPTPKELAELVSLLAFGLLARQGYYTRVERRTEEAGQTLLWAAIWSAPLKLVFDRSFTFAPSLASAIAPAQQTALGFCLNLLHSFAVGWISGVATNAIVRAKRARAETNSGEGAKGLAALISLKPPRLDLSQEWMQESASGKWVVLELLDGRGLLGWVRFYDLDQARAKDMHILLKKVQHVDIATGAVGESIGDEVLVSASQIKLIRLMSA